MCYWVKSLKQVVIVETISEKEGESYLLTVQSGDLAVPLFREKNMLTGKFVNNSGPSIIPYDLSRNKHTVCRRNKRSY